MKHPCSNNHPLQPPIIPVDAEGADQPTGSVSTNTSTSSHSNQPTIVEPINFAQTETKTIVEPSNPRPKSPTKHSEPNVLDQQKASEVTSDKVASESPQQQTPNQQTAITTISTMPDPIEFLACTEQVSELEATDMEIEMSNSSFTSVPDDISETNNPTIPTNNQPSPSNITIQPIAPPKPTKIPSPPTMYLDSSLLADVCENIFQELNRLTQTRNDLIHEHNYEKSWKRLKERVDNVLTTLQRTCMDDQDIAQQKLKDWLK